MGKLVKIPIKVATDDDAESARACDPSASKPSPPRKRRPVAFRQSDVVRPLKAIAKAGFGLAGWRVKLTPDGAITIEAGAPLAQYQIDQEDGAAALDKWMTKHARATEGH